MSRKVKYSCDVGECNRTFDSAQGRTMHRVRAHGLIKGEISGAAVGGAGASAPSISIRDAIANLETEGREISRKIEVLKAVEESMT
jgi:hypothetical protein